MSFDTGERINFTGLTGITGASVGGPDLSGSFTTCGVTSTTVCFGAANPIDLDNIGNSTQIFGTLVIDSTSTDVGSVFYAFSNADRGKGEIDGPVGSSAPEPATLPLLSAGLILSLFSLVKFGKSKNTCSEK